jgi:hypothetical protein
MLGFLAGIGKGIAKGVGALTGVSDLLGGGAKAAKDGRMSEAELQAHINAQNNRAQIDAAQFNAGQQGNLIRRALAARMMGDLQPPSDPRGARFAQPMSPVMQQLLSRYGGMADQDVMSGGYKVQPQMAGIKKSGLLEKIGGIAGTIGGIAGALPKRGAPAQPPTDWIQRYGG